MRRICLICVTVLLTLVGCASKTNSCDVKALLLDESFFPGKVSSDPIYSPISDDFPRDSATRFFYVGYIEEHVYSDGVQQDIVNFDSPSRASNFVESGAKQVFRTDEGKGSWETPNDAKALHLNADETYLACGIAFGGRTCRWLARYDGYYLYLRADISEKGMKESIFIDAVKEMDKRMAQCLSE